MVTVRVGVFQFGLGLGRVFQLGLDLGRGILLFNFSWVRGLGRVSWEERLKCFSVQLCVRAESILASYLLAKEARSPNFGIVKNPLFFPNHTHTLTLLKYRYPNPDPDPKTKEVQIVTSEVTSENLFER